jgi:hypothetical protein
MSVGKQATVGVTCSLALVIRAAAAYLVVIIGCAAALADLAFTTIGYPGDVDQTYVTGVSDNGQIVGFYENASGSHGFLLNGTTFTSLDDPAGIGGTSIQGINNNGHLTGSFFNSTTNGESFINTGGSNFVNFQNPSASGQTPETYAWKINNNGQVVGYFTVGNQGFEGFVRNADGSFVNFNDPSAPIGGNASYGTIARGINDGGQIVGYTLGLNGCCSTGFLRSSDGLTYTTVSVPNSEETLPTDINNNGDIAGYFGDFNGSGGSFVLGSNDIYNIFQDPDALPGDTFAQGINDEGDIVGYYYDQSGAHGFLAAPCDPGSPGCVPSQSIPAPEPASLSLFGTALIGLWAMRRARANRQSA